MLSSFRWSLCAQAYDKHVARTSKRSLRAVLPVVQRELLKHGATMDQWTLLDVVCLTEQRITADHWSQSFKDVNMHPQYRKSLAAWLDHIKPHLVAAAGVGANKEVALEDISKVRPSWLTTEPLALQEEILAAATSMPMNNEWGTPQFTESVLGKLAQLGVADSRLASLFAYVCATQRVQSGSSSSSSASASASASVSASSTVSASSSWALSSNTARFSDILKGELQREAAHGLRSYELKPQGLHGESLMAHMVRLSKMHVRPSSGERLRRLSADKRREVAEHEVTRRAFALGLDVQPGQMRAIMPTSADLTAGALLQLTAYEGPRQARRRYNAIGEVVGSAHVANTAARIESLTEAQRVGAIVFNRKRRKDSTAGAGKTNAEKRRKKEEKDAVWVFMSTSGHFGADSPVQLGDRGKQVLKAVLVHFLQSSDASARAKQQIKKLTKPRLHDAVLRMSQGANATRAILQEPVGDDVQIEKEEEEELKDQGDCDMHSGDDDRADEEEDEDMLAANGAPLQSDADVYVEHEAGAEEKNNEVFPRRVGRANRGVPRASLIYVFDDARE